MSAAIIMFVKTPDLSPIKTRLSKDIGKIRTETFYRLSLKASRAVIAKFQKHSPNTLFYYAVAEENALQSDLWQDDFILYQSNGDLGQRLATIYKESKKKHESVFLIGADTPHLLTKMYLKTEALLKSGHDFVLGPAYDGGFYLFASNKELPESVWTTVHYSSDVTFKELHANLCAHGHISQLDPTFDIDTLADLITLAKHDPKDFTAEQTQVIEWIHRECHDVL